MIIIKKMIAEYECDCCKRAKEETYNLLINENINRIPIYWEYVEGKDGRNHIFCPECWTTYEKIRDIIKE
jgi:hypothetical protein